MAEITRRSFFGALLGGVAALRAALTFKAAPVVPANATVAIRNSDGTVEMLDVCESVTFNFERGDLIVVEGVESWYWNTKQPTGKLAVFEAKHALDENTFSLDCLHPPAITSGKYQNAFVRHIGLPRLWKPGDSLPV